LTNLKGGGQDDLLSENTKEHKTTISRGVPLLLEAEAIGESTTEIETIEGFELNLKLKFVFYLYGSIISLKYYIL
jgi:hypothetical protein